jgi:pyruvate dehydrogenase E1 component beta subunit
MAELTYRQAVAHGIAQELERDERVVLLGEDVAAAGGVFKATGGLLERFGPHRVRDTPISEQAILGAAMGAAMTGLRPIAEIMFSDFLAVCWDLVANEIAKTRYMANGQVTLPLVIRTANGGGLRFGAQHSQSVENWGMAVPGLKVVAPATPKDVVGLLAAAVRDPDPVLFFEHKAAYRSIKGDVPEGEHVVPLGMAHVARPGKHVTLVTYGLAVHMALEAADDLAQEGIETEVVDLRTLRPLDKETVLESVKRTNKVLIVHEDNVTGGIGAELAAIVGQEAFEYLDGPITRLCGPDIPAWPFAATLEEAVLLRPDKIADAIRTLAAY